MIRSSNNGGSSGSASRTNQQRPFLVAIFAATLLLAILTYTSSSSSSSSSTSEFGDEPSEGGNQRIVHWNAVGSSGSSDSVEDRSKRSKREEKETEEKKKDDAESASPPPQQHRQGLKQEEEEERPRSGGSGSSDSCPKDASLLSEDNVGWKIWGPVSCEEEDAWLPRYVESAWRYLLAKAPASAASPSLSSPESPSDNNNNATTSSDDSDDSSDNDNTSEKTPPPSDDKTDTDNNNKKQNENISGQRALDLSERLVFVDVGANKGYTLAHWAVAFTRLGLSGSLVPQLIASLIANGAKGAFCGQCCDCEVGLSMSTTIKLNQSRFTSSLAASEKTLLPFPKFHFFGYEAAKINAKFLKNFYKRFRGWSGMATFRIIHAAMGATVTSMTFPKVTLGNEVGKLGDGDEAVAVKTIDSEFFGHPLTPYIHFLVTDTEGNDPKVFDGARRMFGAGRIGVYMFELHGPAKDNIRVVREASALDYECYMATQRNTKGSANYKDQPLAPQVAEDGGGDGATPTRTEPAQTTAAASSQTKEEQKRGDDESAKTAKQRRIPPYIRLTGCVDTTQLFTKHTEMFTGWFNAICVHRPTQPELARHFQRLQDADDSDTELKDTQQKHCHAVPRIWGAATDAGAFNVSAPPSMKRKRGKAGRDMASKYRKQKREKIVLSVVERLRRSNNTSSSSDDEKDSNKTNNKQEQ